MIALVGFFCGKGEKRKIERLGGGENLPNLSIPIS